MKGLVLLVVVCAAYAAPAAVAPYASALVAAPSPAHLPAHALPPVTYISRYHAQDELGQVNYGFAHPGQAKNEIRDAFGNVAGTYTYIDAENNPVHVEYTAGVDGFQVRSNNLPVGPDASHAPGPVMDTPEVTAAKLKFVEAYNAAAIAAATDSEEIAAGIATIVGQEPVLDTPKVTAAKLDFMEAYNAAAIAAALAPDDELVIKTKSGVDDEMFMSETDEIPSTTQLGVVSDDSSAVTTKAPKKTGEEIPVLPAVADIHEVKQVPKPIREESQSTGTDNAADTGDKAPVEVIGEEKVPQTDGAHQEKEITDEVEISEMPETTTPAPDDAAKETLSVSHRTAGQIVGEIQNVESIQELKFPVEVSPGLESSPAVVLDINEVGAIEEESQAADEASAAEAPDSDLSITLSPFSKYPTSVNGALSPLHVKAFPYSAYNFHLPNPILFNVPAPSREISHKPVTPYYHFVHQNSLNYPFHYAPHFVKYQYVSA